MELELKMNDQNLCKGTANVYSRISGYYRPIGLWNDGKVSEYDDRKTYSNL
jgi:ribonucleoside-triphosphate reductase